jgi:membrane protease YdiL (CAAX protease family)
MSQTGSQKPALPFNNLFLNAGAVTGNNHWFIYVAGVMATVMGYVIYQFLIITPLISMAEAHGHTKQEIISDPNILFNPAVTGIDKNVMLAIDFGMFVFALMGLYTVISRIHKKTLTSVITAYDKIRWKRFFFAFAVWGFMVAGSIISSYFYDPSSFKVQFNASSFIMLLIVTIVLLPIQTSTEEIFFRGYLMQGLSQVFKNGIVPLLITSLLFGVVHSQNPESKAYGLGIMLPYYSLFALFLGTMTLLDEGLELAMGVHCANNLVSCLLITSPNSVLKTDAVFVQDREDPLMELIAWAVFATITFIILWRKYRWKNFNLIIK